ncbi:MAG: type II secretion system F family protein [Actinomycetota bacterium]
MTALVVGVLVWLAPGLGLVVGSLVVAWRPLRHRRAAAAEAGATAAALPSAIEMCVVVLGAGGTIADCLRALADAGPPPVRGPTAAVLAANGRGLPLDPTLRRWQRELGPAYQPLTGALLLAWEQGGPIGPLLDRLAVEAAAARRRQGDLRARRLPVLLLLPLVGCSLPAVIVGALVPVAVVAFVDARP